MVDVAGETTPNPPSGSIAGTAAAATGGISALGDNDVLPNIETRSSSGFVDVPDRIFFAAGSCSTCVATSPVGPSCAGSSSKSGRFSAAWPAATVWNPVFAESAMLEMRAVVRSNGALLDTRNQLTKFLCAGLTRRRSVLDR